MPTANFNSQVQETEFRGNLILEIDGVMYAQHEPDSGVVIDADKIGLVNSVDISGTTIDFERVKTSIPNVTIRLLDKDGVITAAIGNSDSAWHKAEVKVYFGFITGSFDFADYELLATNRIKSISRRENEYSIQAADPADLLQVPVFQESAILDTAINPTDITIVVDAVPAGVPTAGFLVIDNEWIQYSNIVGLDITVADRGARGSTAADHAAEAAVFFVTEKDDHPIDIFLDVLQNDVGIDAGLIDLTGITAIKTTNFPTDGNFILRAFQVDNALTWLEKNILEETNCRIINKNGQISLTVMDQVDFTGTEFEIDEDSIQRQPGYTVNNNRLRNRIIIEWDHQEGSNTYARTDEFFDQDSIDLYGEGRLLRLQFPGVRVANGGSAIVTDRAARLLARFGTPTASINITTHLNRFNANAGDNVRLTHRYLPASGGGLGFSEVLEVASKSFRGLATNASINFKLVFTSFTGIRIGLIAPAPLLTGVITSQSEFEVPDGACYGVGYCVRLWDEVTGNYTADPINQITEIDGNTIKVATPFVTTLGPTIRLKFCDYDNASNDQRGKYAFIAPNTGVFASDGSGAYQIII